MGSIGTLVACILAGVLLKRSGVLQSDDATAFNKLIIYFFIPVISLLHIPTMTLNSDLIWLSISPFIVFLAAFLFFGLFRSTSLISKESSAALTLTCGISSTSFVGFPIFEMLYGDQGLSYGIFLSLGGTILVFNTIGIGYLLMYSSKSTMSWSLMMEKFFSFFPFIVFVIALLCNVLEISFHSSATKILRQLASPFSVIALLAIGLQMELKTFTDYKFEILIGQLFKLVLAPLIIYLIVWVIFGRTDLLAKICVLGAGIGSMNAISILAAEKNVQPKLSILMPAIGIPLSVFSLFIIDNLLN